VISRHFIPVAAGARLDALSTGGFSVTDARYDEPHTLPPHAHQRSVVVFVLGGLVRERFGSRLEDCARGTALTIPAGHSHSETFTNRPTHGLIVEIGDDKACALRLGSTGLCRHAAIRGHQIAALGDALYREFRSPDDATPLAVDGLLLQLAAAATRDGRRPPPIRPRWLVSVTDAIRAELKAPLRIADLAHDAGVHPVYLARAFRRHYGCSPADFIRRLRVDAARTALAGTDLPISAVARLTGFADQSHLTRIFRRAVGTSPGCYRRELRR
jgi:AraC family transcriptional regulator